MARLNVTLDRNTYAQLERHAKRLGKPRAKVVKDILCEGLAKRTAADRRKKLARDYVAGRADARALLKDLESPQLDLLGDEEA
jgi:hypothetical protein